MADFLLIVRGSGGDLFPFTRIGKALKKRGHSVTMLTHYCFEDLVSSAGIEFAALDTPREFEQMKQDQALLTNAPKDLIVFYRKHILPRAIEKYEIIKEQCQSQNTILVSHQTCHLNAQLAAEKLDIPLVLAFSAPGFARGLPVLAGLFKSLATHVNQIRAEIDLPPVHNWGAWLRAANQHIGFWPDWFDLPDADYPPGLVPVGFVLDDNPATAPIPEEAQAIFSGEEAPILITHGTTAPTHAEFFAASAEACHRLGHQGILVSLYEEMVPAPLPDGVRWVKYLPFSSLLPRMRAIIHHGGIGTLGQALIAGIPQLVLPLGLDRPDNALRLERLGVGEFLLRPQWQPDLIAQALWRLMDSQSVQERCKEMAHHMNAIDADPVTTACDAIELGASTRYEPERFDAPEQVVRRAEQLAGLSPEKRALLARRLKG